MERFTAAYRAEISAVGFAHADKSLGVERKGRMVYDAYRRKLPVSVGFVWQRFESVAEVMRIMYMVVEVKIGAANNERQLAQALCRFMQARRLYVETPSCSGV